MKTFLKILLAILIIGWLIAVSALFGGCKMAQPKERDWNCANERYSDDDECETPANKW